VAGDFPRLTADTLAGVDLDHSRLTDVRYRVDLSVQPVGAAVPKSITDIIATEVTT
jgi:hypothetical protein